MGPVNIGYKVNPQWPRVGCQGFAGHQGSQIGAANAQIHHIREGLSGASPQLTPADRFHKLFHPVEDFFHQNTGLTAIA
jgi:hypothetical protein